MEITALILVLIGSFMHLGWNILTKKSDDKLAFLCLAVFPWSLLLCLGQLNSLIEVMPAISFLMASIVIHAIYFWTLTKAYYFADLSFVYPFSRGVGSLFTFLGGLFLLNENISIIGMSGIAVCILATFLGAYEIKNSKGEISFKGIIFTFFTGLLIASYLVIDKVGVTRTSTNIYLPLMLLGTSSTLIPILYYQGRIKKEIRSSGIKIMISGFTLYLGYGLILYAMETAPVSYIVAARASGIIFSAVAGVFFFHERIPRLRYLSILMITLGIVLISLS